MKIAYVVCTNFPEGDAVARRIHAMGKGLTALGHEVHLVIPQRFTPGPLFEKFDNMYVHWGMVTTQTTWNRFSERLAGRLGALRQLDQIAANELDWLVLYNLGLDGLPFLFAAQRYGARVAAEYCDLRIRPQQPTLIQRVQYRWHTTADLLIPKLTQLNIVISKLLEKQLRATASQTPIVLVPALVDTDRFQYQAADAMLFRSHWEIEDTTVISYLGGYWNVDGVKVLLQAARELVDANKKFKVVISGMPLAGRDCDDVPRLIEELGLQEKVVLTGWLTTDQVVAAMSAADILVVPKINHIINQAGFPTKLAEYLAVSRAVVTSRIGDIPLYLTDGENALLCEPGDPHSLAQALTKLLDEPALRKQLAQKARHTALQFFSYQGAVKPMEAAMVAIVPSQGGSLYESA